MNSVTLKPNASSLIESLRDIGYSLDTAIADIIDNSITANAQNINIFFDTFGELKIAILDDGCGMAYDELINAMKIGSKSPLEDRDNKDLGRFGLGLKTASFSQCRKLTVISSREGNTCGARWNLDNLTDDWNLEILNQDNIKSSYKNNKLQDNGTLVIWENTDRIIDNTIKKSTEDLIYEKFDDVKKHLELVFHRYLEGEIGKIKKVNIFINGANLNPFDPFNKKNYATQKLSSETIEVNNRKIIIQNE